MIPSYRLLANRIRHELDDLAKVVQRAEDAVTRAKQSPADQDFFFASASLDLHGFYAGTERLFELVADNIDRSRPTSPHWHRDLLEQMAVGAEGVRPALIQQETQNALREYLDFRHVIRNVYTFNLRPTRVAELVKGVQYAYVLVKKDLLAFAQYLDQLARADEVE